MKCPSDKPGEPKYEEPELQEIPTESPYEEPATLCKLQQNIAYEIPPSRIKTNNNEAYGATSNA